MSKRLLLLVSMDGEISGGGEVDDGLAHRNVWTLFRHMASDVGLSLTTSKFDTVDGPMVTGLGGYQTDSESGHGFVIRLYLADGTWVEPDCSLLNYDGVSPDEVVVIVVREVCTEGI